ncbi:protein SIEVE ELEMENT OCCLUSION B-like [Corylus avellana]|uniref:protein SIEVE ELEMENT OCCLUSION B-like n=1 Tax=Corylus avellana TaxID=13451 RepID=UPI00286A30D3|nr:protein SIEVE ELEMENT OCCLUSION B-like [Corylus avellana]
MASYDVSVSGNSLQQPKKGDLSLFAFTDDEIMNQIYATHVHDVEKFDVESLFIVVENILKRATQVADNVVLGTQGNVEHLEEKTPKPTFSPPLCTLKNISCEMQCQAPGEETAYETTLSILNKLSHYSWNTKAVLTLAAFALDYGDFWLLAQSQSTDQLAKSMGTLRRVSVLLKRPTLQKHRQSLIELNTLIRSTLEVIECIVELEKLPNYATDVPALSTCMAHIPVDVFWAIATVVASTTQLCCLTSDEDKKQELSQFSQKINVILTKLRRQITLCRQQIEEGKAYWELKKIFRTRTEIMEVIKALIYSKDNPQPLFDGFTKIPVNIDVVKGKNVLLFISGLDISNYDISSLRSIYDSISKGDEYKIVWIPIVDQWTDELQKKFKYWVSNFPWYAVQYFSLKASIRFIKEDWYFNGTNPSVVVVNPQGMVVHENAIHMIRLWGMMAFPFTTLQEENLSTRRDWFVSIATNVHPNIDNWIKDEKYIFFYGGKDKEWIQQIAKRLTALANDAAIKEARIPIELVCVGKGSKGEDNLDILGRFWTGIESMFISKTHRKTEIDSTTLEIQKLLSYKNESGWAVLTKGSNVVLSGHGTTMSNVVQEVDKWKGFVHDKGFEFTFKDHHNKLLRTVHICCCIEISNTSGRILQNMKCPDCSRIMETYISFKCCHSDGSANGVH